MNIQFANMSFNGKPQNYAVVDSFLSRSAQPQKDDFAWLKEQGITDIINFRTMLNNEVTFDEKAEVEKLGMKYHNIPSVTTEPKEENIDKFFKTVENVKQNGRKAHIHCKAGADRTGMYVFLYKMKNGLGTLPKNQAEWFEHGYHYLRYPDLMEWARNFACKFHK